MAARVRSRRLRELAGGTIRKEKAKIKSALPSARDWDIVAVGENSVDLVAVVRSWPDPDTKARLDDLRLMTGGQVATAAIAAARLGARVRYLGAIGGDDWGDRVRDALAPHCDATLIRKDGARTRSAVLVVDAEGRRTVLESRDPELRVIADDLPAGWVESGRLLMIDAAHPDASLAAAARARAAGVPVIVDLETPGESASRLLEGADIVIMAREFPEAQTGESSPGDALRTIAERYRPALLVVTLGEEGALARIDGQEIRVPAFAVNVVDTTGAGDAFRGGFAASWIELGDEAPVDELLRRAAIVAALNCRTLGAQAGLPTRAELARWL